MSFIALESTGNLWLTTVVLVAVIDLAPDHARTVRLFVCDLALHLRGETIRSAADVGWIRDLTVSRLMRPDVAMVDAGIGIDEIPVQISLGSKTQVVAVDATGRYVGCAVVAEAHARISMPRAASSASCIIGTSCCSRLMNIQEAIACLTPPKRNRWRSSRATATPAGRDLYRSHAMLALTRKKPISAGARGDRRDRERGRRVRLTDNGFGSSVCAAEPGTRTVGSAPTGVIHEKHPTAVGQPAMHPPCR
jgi:hypothetical protein